ncbi:hypothetical protein AGMMS49593_08650 [Endomicrobiia bacterium]|nr:hypothetical protein AGMMS49593_08650 [Endomicrobiia bacterium]
MLNELNYNISDSDLLKNLKIAKDIFNKIELVGESSKNFNFKNFRFPNLRKLDLLPKFIVRILDKLLWVKVDINKKYV